MNAKTPDEPLDDLEPVYDTTGMFGPEWEKSVVREIRSRATDPAQSIAIDAEAAFDEVDALLDRL